VIVGQEEFNRLVLDGSVLCDDDVLTAAKASAQDLSTREGDTHTIPHNTELHAFHKLHTLWLYAKDCYSLILSLFLTITTVPHLYFIDLFLCSTSLSVLISLLLPLLARISPLRITCSYSYSSFLSLMHIVFMCMYTMCVCVYLCVCACVCVFVCVAGSFSKTQKISDSERFPSDEVTIKQLAEMSRVLKDRLADLLDEKERIFNHRLKMSKLFRSFLSTGDLDAGLLLLADADEVTVKDEKRRNYALNMGDRKDRDESDTRADEAWTLALRLEKSAKKLSTGDEVKLRRKVTEYKL
jgi:hypothetical protein